MAEITQDGERVHGGVSVHRTPWQGVFKHVNTVVGGEGQREEYSKLKAQGERATRCNVKSLMGINKENKIHRKT